MKVPFNRLSPVGKEREYVEAAIRSGAMGGTGHFARRCESLLVDIIGGGQVLLTCSATAGLEIAALLAGLGPGDEVVMPSFNFVSAANAVVLRGARVVFAEIDPATLNICPDDLARRITDRTRAVMPIDYAGVGCDIERIKDISRANGLVVVEDAAQGVGSRLDGRPLGHAADLAVVSFHGSKNIGCGEGGALIVNDPELVERGHVIRDKGTNRRSFLAGEVDKYSWVDVGSSYAISELSAAYLLGQLEQIQPVTAHRVALWNRYAERLAPAREAGTVSWNDVPDRCSHNGHIFYLLVAGPAERDALISHLASAGVQAYFHYVPLHLAPMGRAMGYAPGDLPVTEDLAARLLRLPLHYGLDAESIDYVAGQVLAFYGHGP